jgi:hypothetical protein
MLRLLGGAFLILSAVTVNAQESGSTHAFAYDHKMPLDIREAGVDQRCEVARCSPGLKLDFECSLFW